MTVLIYYIFQIGLLWGYGQAVWIDQLAVLYAVNCIFILVLIVDCFLCNIKAYYSHGLLVTHPKLIVKRYLKVRVYLDILAIISIMIPFISKKYALNWCKALFLLKFYQVYEIDKQFIRVSQLKVSYHTFYLLSRLVFFLILGSHYLGIWFYMIDYWVYSNNYYGPNTPMICWIYNAQSYSQLVLLLPWYGQYLYTMYFSIGTMTTIAYGDITPLNPIQTIYITLALVAYTISFAYILSQILRILMQAQASKFQHSNNLLIVSNMMKNNMIKQKTQSKVKSYFQKVWKQQIYRNRQIQIQLIQQLPQKIRNQLFTQLYQQFFNSLYLYYPGSDQKIHTNFMIAIANQIRQQRLVQDHILYKYQQQYDGQNLNNHIFYYIKQLKKGIPKPSIQIGVKDLVIQTYSQGDIGIQGFFTGDPRDHWARVILSVLVYQLPRKILLDNLHLATQVEQQNICLIAQNIYNRKCYVCKQIGHNFKYCQYVTYQPNKKQLLKYHLSLQMLSKIKNKKKKGNTYNVHNKTLYRQQQQDSQQQNNNQRKYKIHYNTLILYKDIKNTKFKVRNKYQLMLNDKYYRKLFSFKDTSKTKKKRKAKDDFYLQYHQNQGKKKININTSENANINRKASRDKIYAQTMKTNTKLAIKLSPTNQPKQMNLLQQQNQPAFKLVQQQQQIQQRTYSHPQTMPTNPRTSLHRGQTLLTNIFGITNNNNNNINNIVQQQQQNNNISSSSQSQSQSSQSSVDLQNYVKQTQLYIRHLQNDTISINQTDNTNYNIHINQYHQIQYDICKQYTVYNPSQNINQIIGKYNKYITPKRRNVQKIKYKQGYRAQSHQDFNNLRGLNTNINNGNETIKGLLNQSLLDEQQQNQQDQYIDYKDNFHNMPIYYGGKRSGVIK